MNNYKRIFSSILCVLMLSTVLSGCSSKGDVKVYKAGKYTESVNGHNGEMVVEVSFTDELIEKIDIVSHVETDGISDGAFDKVPSAIIEKQSTDVDTISGCTVSSKAIISAVEKAMSEACVNTVVKDTFNPGTYSAKATGMNGELEVEVSVSEKAIESIETKHVESDGIGSAAIDILTNEVLSNQSLKIDALSGASVTSNAFISALNDAIDQSGISKNVLDKDLAITKATNEVILKSADVIIVGAGGAGYAAAVSVVEAGGSVIMIEKNEYIGGNTARAGGTLNAPDPARQEPIGVVDSVENFYNNIMEAGDFVSNKDLALTLAENALSARTWLSDHGTKWTEQVYLTIGGLFQRSMDVAGKNSFTQIISPLSKTLEGKKAEVILNLKAEELIVNEKNEVIGVRALDTKNGQKYELNGKNGVILTTGGYAQSADLCLKYNNLSGLPSSNAPTSTGDGLVMATAIGADLEGMDYIQIHPHGNPQTGSLQSAFAGTILNSIYVNIEGKRFVEESGRRDEISNATIKQTGQTMYSIFDSVGGFYTGVLVYEGLEDLIAKKYVYRADTIEELAKLVGINAEELTKTITRYNELVVSGKDSDFNKKELGNEIMSAPFYAVPLSPTVHHTMGGLKINTSAQVLKTSGEVIKGLYAAGEVTGGIHGSNRIGGNAITDIIVFGRIAGNTIMGK